MADFRPSFPYSTALKLLKPECKLVKGVKKKVYPEDGELIWCSFKTYGGTERDVNGVYTIEDTANVETWYRPDITSDGRVMETSTGAVYEIMNEPENVNMRNQFCKFKVRRVKGGA